MKKLLMCLALMLSLTAVAAAGEIKISAKVVSGTVVADVEFVDNPGIAGFAVNMNFDKTKLTPVSVTTGDVLSGSVTSNLHIEEDYSDLDHVSAVWVNNSDVRKSGVFYTVVFAIKDGAKGSTELTLEYSSDNISNASLENVAFDTTGAVINLGGGTSSGGTTVVRPSTGTSMPKDEPDDQPDDEPETFEPTKIYADVNENDWYFADVAYVYQKGLMTGTANEPELLFSPLINTNRAMFVTVLYRMEGEPTANKSAFTDVEAGSYYENAVAWAAANGIVNGISPTEFAPLSDITREQTAKIIANYAAYKGLDIPEPTADISSFVDYSSVSDWAVDALQICADMNIIRGRNDNTIDPQGATTRAETAAILRRLVEYMGK